MGACLNFFRSGSKVPWIVATIVMIFSQLGCQKRGASNPGFDVPIDDPNVNIVVKLGLNGAPSIEIDTCQAYQVSALNEKGVLTPVSQDTEVTLSVSGGGNFYQDSICGMQISSLNIPVGSRDISTYFKGSSVGPRTLSVQDAQAILAGASLAVTVTSSVSISISDGPAYDFGNRLINSATNKIFTLTNTGNSPATSVGPGLPVLNAPFSYVGGAFPGSGGTCTSSLVGNSSCSFVIVFQPTSVQSYSDVIRIQFNDGAGQQTITRSITGAGINSSGLDTSFSGDGMLTVPFSASGDDRAYDVAVQSDGKLVVSGGTFNGSTNFDFAIVRLNVDGSLDNSFGNQGKVTTAVSALIDYALAVKIQADGRIVVAGYAHNGTNTDFAVGRYLTDGTLDTTFGSGGIKLVDINGKDDFGWDCVIQSDSKIVVGGYSKRFGKDNFALIRLNTDGNLDTGFGSGGKVTTTVGSSSSFAHAIGIQKIAPNAGKIILAGYATFSSQDFALTRYNSSGSLDTTFGSSGVASINFEGNIDKAFSLAIQGDDKVVIAGTNYTGTYNDFAMARLNVNGTMDSGFGSAGKVTTAVGPYYDEIHAIAIQTDGKIVAAGHVYNASVVPDFGVLRYTPNGTLDSSFGEGGKLITPIGSDTDRAEGIVIQADGRIVVVGDSRQGSNLLDFAVVRYLP